MIFLKKKAIYDQSIVRDLATGKFGFIDVGSGIGGSITFCENRFNRGKGLGIDKNNGKIDKALAAGHRVICANISNFPIPKKSVSFCSMMDVIEHLPDIKTTIDILKVLSKSARDFLFIRHPSFEDMEYLASHNLKLTWTDWSCHTNMLRLEDFKKIFKSLGLKNYIIIPRKRYTDSTGDMFIPLSAPRNIVKYDATLHGAKNIVTFSKEIFGQFDIFIKLNKKLSEQEWTAIMAESWQQPAVLTEQSASNF